MYQRIVHERQPGEPIPIAKLTELALPRCQVHRGVTRHVTLAKPKIRVYLNRRAQGSDFEPSAIDTSLIRCMSSSGACTHFRSTGPTRPYELVLTWMNILRLLVELDIVLEAPNTHPSIHAHYRYDLSNELSYIFVFTMNEQTTANGPGIDTIVSCMKSIVKVVYMGSSHFILPILETVDRARSVSPTQTGGSFWPRAKSGDPFNPAG